jgi:multicomponent Na+:H+ antiporter subunit E
MAEGTTHTGNKNLSRLITFVLLLVFWIVFSGKFDAFHFGLGILSCAVVALVSHGLLFSNIGADRKLAMTGRFLLYLPWLIYQVILANLHVAKLVLSPGGIHPRVVEIKTKLKSDLSMVTFANSITLTPGTITMDIADGTFYVHAISQKVADDLLSGDMENRVAKIFFEDDR